MTVRTRIAPSPTGEPHVGTAYVALFNQCFAKAHGGEFILRIEDTDQGRSTPESEKAILDSLKWLGLEWSEGPDCGGDKGPYRQSERKDIYADYAYELVEKGHAFHCFCSSERLSELRQQQIADKTQIGYDGHCKSLSKEQVASKIAVGESHVVRMDIPREGICEVQDMLRGQIDIEWSQIDMQVLLKADGMPTYHLANVVDDHLMEITHVIRGEEWINSAPKHILLYQYFGWDMPQLCHLPLLRNTDKSKLSKRKNPTGILYYKEMGYLPEALLNYLGRMGWSMPDEREQFTLAEMQQAFDIHRVSLGGPIFDNEKLNWLNSQWIRDLSDDELANKLVEWAFNREKLMQFLPFAKPRMETFSDVAPLGSYLLSGMLKLKEADFTANKLELEQQMEVMQFALWRLEALRQWDRDSIFNTLKALSSEMDIKIKDFLAPLFVAVAGTTESISVIDSAVLIGPDVTRARLRHAINQTLGGFGKKKLKKMDKAYLQLGQ